MIEKLKLLLSELAVANNVDEQQALRYLISNIKELSLELELDFDLALDKSDLVVELTCQHPEAYPCGIDSVFCPICKEYVIEGKKTEIVDYLKYNHWRPE